MLVLGISGGIDLIHESRFVMDGSYLHDSAAVLVEDGRVVAGVEEERLNRIKHSNKCALRGARFCLESRGLKLSDLDHIAIYATEQFLNVSLATLFLHKPEVGAPVDARGLYQRLFENEFGCGFDPARFRFVPHHTAHVMGSYGLSGFDDALIFSADGAGEDVSTLVIDAVGQTWTEQARWGLPDSLGIFYLDAIRFLGYELFDEYKVMGLAPYGDPARFRPHFEKFYSLLPDGGYAIRREQLLELFHVLMPRRRGEDFTQVHQDFAATLQQVLEDIVFHVLRHHRERSRRDRLVLSGGVAQNSTLAGKILSSGLFRDVYAGPSTADSGCAIGAALQVSFTESPARPRGQVTHAYWGPCAGEDQDIEQTLTAWSSFVDIRRLDNLAGETAQLLANGSVIGWVQGASEFGPRALGNRSILADPRPAANKELINAMIKKREGYRPFAPSILRERVDEFFVLPGETRDFPFMSFVMPVQPKWREHLGAITHIDGTARLQTVTRPSNPLFWELIAAFGELTGVPILLNTSFNNNAEPIVQTVDEAVVCFLDSGLHHLVAGNYLVSKKTVTDDTWENLIPELPREVICSEETRRAADGSLSTVCLLARNYDSRRKRTLSPAASHILRQAAGDRTLRQLDPQILPATVTEIRALWSDRYVILKPAQS